MNTDAEVIYGVPFRVGAVLRLNCITCDAFIMMSSVYPHQLLQYAIIIVRALAEKWICHDDGIMECPAHTDGYGYNPMGQQGWAQEYAKIKRNQ